jgi:hypothetical protein
MSTHNQEFKLIKYEMRNATSVNADNAVVYSVLLTIAFKRKPSFYTVIIVVPSTLIITLALFGVSCVSHCARRAMHRHVHANGKQSVAQREMFTRLDRSTHYVRHTANCHRPIAQRGGT